MKANELRIGNLLSFNNMITKEEIVKVNAWFLRQLVHDPNVENPQLTGYYQPIPLTDEWLIKFGFKFGINLQDFVKGKHQFVEFGTLNGYFSENGILYFGINTKIRYVHQLQNLYFALTGEELTLKK